MGRSRGDIASFYRTLGRKHSLLALSAELRAARAWSLAKTAEHFLVTIATIASWTGRLNEEGADALVRMREPVNRYPDFVAYLVRRLKVLCPTMGKVRIANVLCRAGLHLGSTTVRRM